MRYVFGFLSLTLMAQSAFAVNFVEVARRSGLISQSAVASSSYCEWGENQSVNQIRGYRQDQLVNIASISKVFTSYLAVTKLGAFRRFNSAVLVVPVAGQRDVFDVQIRGQGDPYFTWDKLFFVISELNRQGVFYVRNLYFDDGVRVFLSFRENMHNMWQESTSYRPGRDYVNGTVPAADTQASLRAYGTTSRWNASTRRLYAQTRALAARSNIAMTASPRLVIQNVSHGIQFSGTSIPANSRLFHLSSRPLIDYLKDMNKYSINFIADQIFHLSGGLPALEDLLINRVHLARNEFDFHTGSGLPDRRGGGRRDNRATCSAVLKVLDSFSDYLEAQRLTPQQQLILGHEQISLADILLVSGRDSDATFGGVGPGSVVVKTGTLNNASNLAGVANTHDGAEYFGIFLFRNGSTGPLNQLRRRIVSLILGEHHGAEAVASHRTPTFTQFLAFDSTASFQNVTARAVASNQ